jgi:predicted small secreted protein
MVKAVRMVVAVLALGLLVASCANTMEGLKQDWKKHTEKK